MVRHSVVIKCLNGAETIGEALDSLLAQRPAPDFEIVLADNGSTDATCAIFAERAARNPGVAMRLVDVSARRGRAHALNAGIRAASGDRLLFLDADDTVEPGWFAAMAAALEAHDFVAARLDLARLNDPALAGLRPLEQAHGLARLPYAPFCLNAGGATLGFHRRVFDALGGFDPALGSLEDEDFCVRAHLAGFELRFAPDAVYNYRFRSDLRGIRRQAHDYARARALIVKRYGRAAAACAPGPWLGICAFIALTWLKRRAAGALGRKTPLAKAARLERSLGRALGSLAGAIDTRTAPGPEFAQASAQMLRRTARSAAQRLLAPFYGSVVSARTDRKVLALTFDDGPDPETTPRLLDALARHGAKATFFVIGARAEKHPDLIARMLREGHEVGNHTWDHPSLPAVPLQGVSHQFARTRALLAPHGTRLLRPPYGDQNPRINRIARRMGYLVVLWSISGGDWRGEDSHTLAARILAGAKPGGIVLLHDSLYSFESEAARDRAPTIEAVAQVIERLPDYRFVTVSEMLAEGKPVARAAVKATDWGDLAALEIADA